MKNRSVVKGVARRAVIVRSPDPRMFEEAIFIVREDYANAGRREQGGGAQTGAPRRRGLSARHCPAAEDAGALEAVAVHRHCRPWGWCWRSSSYCKKLRAFIPKALSFIVSRH